MEANLIQDNQDYKILSQKNKIKKDPNIIQINPISTSNKK